MIPVPETNGLDMALGNISHLPAWELIPKEFKDRNRHTPWNDFISKWFFVGLKPEDVSTLKPKEGIDKNKALAAIKAILASWDPKHEHKEAGAAYLMSEWFEEPKV